MHKHKPKMTSKKPSADQGEFTVRWIDIINVSPEDKKRLVKQGTIDSMKPYSRNDQQAPE